MGVIGRNPAGKGETPQPRFRFGKPDSPHRALAGVTPERLEAAAAPFLSFLTLAAENDGAPLFSGGVLDSWPAWAVDALAIRKQEVAAIQAYERHQVIPR